MIITFGVLKTQRTLQLTLMSPGLTIFSLQILDLYNGRTHQNFQKYVLESSGLIKIKCKLSIARSYSHAILTQLCYLLLNAAVQ
jgi:hypothetical protein